MTETLNKPISKLRTNEDLEIFKNSKAFQLVFDFVYRLAVSVHGHELTDSSLPKPASITNILSVFESINKIIDNNPVKNDTSSRFGKPEFKDFYDELQFQLPQLIRKITFSSNLPTDQQLLEIETYLLNSFGDRTRIDYGSGHELNFICFLLCLDILKYFTDDSTDVSIVLIIFNEYLKTMRRLQLIYWLEPAGSHGVWGLDDYHFLPFLFGAAQLSPQLRPRPSTIHNADYVEEFKNKYYYYGMVDFIVSTKTGPPGNEEPLSLRWSSPMLDDISGVKTWKKIEEGLFKMYKAEVLSKLPIVQHFLFGEIIECPELPEHEHEDNVDNCCDHSHDLANTWGDCCGIRIPSSAAAKMAENRGKIPFD
ncbi:peptidylprolyl isomerase [Martiniozyma asiatica (nom. inval.)]|nr:peptidylprolyl isomerase [Martiniozyma asiatica]